MASFLSSSFKNVPAALTLHSLSETVNFTSLSFFGLVCSFHSLYSSLLFIFNLKILLNFNYFVNCLIIIYPYGKYKIQIFVAAERFYNARSYRRVEVYINEFVFYYS